MIAVVADTHLPRGGRLPDACVCRIAAADLLIHAGDFSTVAAYEQLAAIGPRLVAVHGNVDEPALARLLPERTTIEVAGARIAVVFGHSHLPLLESEAGFQIFNPGSPTERRRAPARTMGIAEVSGGEVRFRHLTLG